MIRAALRIALLAAAVPAAATRAEEAPWPGDPAGEKPALRVPRNEETNPLRLFGSIAIKSYRRFASPLLPSRCGFFPSCSGYALAAVSELGLINGTILGSDRIMRCHGFAALGGYGIRPQDGLLDDPLAGKPAPLPWLSRFGF